MDKLTIPKRILEIEERIKKALKKVIRFEIVVNGKVHEFFQSKEYIPNEYYFGLTLIDAENDRRQYLDVFDGILERLIHEKYYYKDISKDPTFLTAMKNSFNYPHTRSQYEKSGILVYNDIGRQKCVGYLWEKLFKGLEDELEHDKYNKWYSDILFSITILKEIKERYNLERLDSTPSVFEPLDLEIKAKKYLDSQIKHYLDNGFNEEDFWTSDLGVSIGALKKTYEQMNNPNNKSSNFHSNLLFLDCEDDGKSLMWYAGLDCKKKEDIEPWHLEYFRLGHREHEKYKSNPNDYKFNFLEKTTDNQSEFKETKIESKKNGNDKQTIEKYLKPLSGNWNGSRIMSNEDFERLNEYVFYLVENKKIPETIQTILQTNIPMEFVRKTFQSLYKSLYLKNTSIRILWIEFLIKTFKQFESWELDSINKNFATYRNNYEHDLNKITYSD
jgi:hypothetical protein